jgi:hypothetical protein
LPVKRGMRSFDVNAPGGGVAGAEADGAAAREEAASEPVQDATRSSGTARAAAHRRRRRPVRGLDIVLLL